MFTEREKQYLTGILTGRLATIGPAGPMNHPVACWVDFEDETVRIGGPNLGQSRKARNVAADPRVSIAIDEMTDEEVGPAGSGQRGRGLEIRGDAEVVPTDHPKFDGFSREVLRIRPRRILSWNVEGPGTHNRTVR